MRVYMSVNLAAILMRSGRIREAERVLANQVDLLEDDNTRFQYLRGQRQLAVARRDTVAMRRAIDAMGALSIRSAQLMHHYWNGVLRARNGDLEAAYARLDRMRDARDPEADGPGLSERRLRAMIALAEGDPHRARAELDSIPSYMGEYGWAAMQPLQHQLVVEVILAQGDLEGALAAQEDHAKRCGYSSEAYLELARLYGMAGRHEESAAALARALHILRESDPDSPVLADARAMAAPAMLEAGARQLPAGGARTSR
jgi:tetratricopeptide (TPR) repeat protein